MGLPKIHPYAAMQMQKLVSLADAAAEPELPVQLALFQVAILPDSIYFKRVDNWPGGFNAA